MSPEEDFDHDASLQNRWRRSDGTTMVEYALLAVAIGIAAIIAVNALVERIGEAAEEHRESVLETPGGDASDSTVAPTSSTVAPTSSALAPTSSTLAPTSTNCVKQSQPKGPPVTTCG
jgi:Flp pilus assembly pilin Flp